MYIVSLTYHRPIEEVDSHLEGHIAWLKKYFAQGDFIAAGRKNPRNGGVILAKQMARSQLDAILAQDPFTSVANYEVTELAVTAAGEDFSNLLNL
ncbi:hypothetical protein KH388_01030 [Serratia rubidaea]|nr:hypothetical protein [Serratia rubidaea]